MNDVILAKVASIQCCIQRARLELAVAGAGFDQDLTRQDAAVLNVLRACETAIDLANVLIRGRQLGIPPSNRDSFRLLAEAGVIPAEMSARLQRMVGFRNVAVHRYRDLDLAILASVITRDLDDLLDFSERVAKIA
jgi:uncharacterized protein YutE (UPF0331/DUF86 family)